MREKDIHRSLKDKNIIRMVEIIEDESVESSDSDKQYLVLEFAERGQILDYDIVTKKFWP
jgi:serine/threonine protein kinase